MEDLLGSIRYNDGKFPRKQLQQIIEGRDEAIPLLLEIVEEVKANPEEFVNSSSRIDHIYALYLLAQFRVKQLYPLFIEILRLPGETLHYILSDTLTEAAHRILASTYNGNIDLLKGLIENDEIDEYARGAALRSLAALVLNNQLQRDEIIAYFKELLTGKLQHLNYHVNANIVSCCDDLYPLEVYSEIKQLYEKGEVAEYIISLQDVEETLKMSQEDVLKRNKQDVHLQFIDDTIKELHWWACFEQPKSRRNPNLLKNFPRSKKTNPAVKVEKVGRNDPCPCGSGLKYKKCCGKG
ncbi:DUF1186 domain-containing protein [Pueribacillus theae]|uniref:DUF1186 domain-containing protein n=1 Tax=Pueribacillus theae TaxID=2171751 RepID=UPI0014036DFD|nr:DUF1186 domain-containing protein [Pueribacillus theae]